MVEASQDCEKKNQTRFVCLSWKLVDVWTSVDKRSDSGVSFHLKWSSWQLAPTGCPAELESQTCEVSWHLWCFPEYRWAGMVRKLLNGSDGSGHRNFIFIYFHEFSCIFMHFPLVEVVWVRLSQIEQSRTKIAKNLLKSESVGHETTAASVRHF